MRTYLIRGMLAGLCAAFVAFGFAYLTGEPSVDHAIAFEESHAATEADAHAAGAADHAADATAAEEAEPVSRTVQRTVGLFAGLAVTGVALGGLFSIAFAFAYGRLGALDARSTAVVVAGLSFVAVYLTPYLKYPPNPPAVGDPTTIGRRTALYFTLMFVSVVAMALAVNLARRWTPRFGAWNATLLAALGYLAVVVFCVVALPIVDEVPADFPATVLWPFRLSSLGIQFVLYTTIGLVFGALTARSTAKATSPDLVPCLLYTSPSPRDGLLSRMPSSA